jgi:hypothetical protein
LFCKIVEEPDERLREESYRKENADARLENLRSTLRDGSILDAAAEHLVGWAKAGADSERTDALIRVMDFIAKVLRELGPQPVLNEVIRRLLEGPPEAILQWEEESRPGFDALIALWNELSALGAPGETIQRLVAWVVESGGFDLDRIAQISKARESIGRPFSERARQQLWLRFLYETVGTTHSEPRLSA